jgi:hypothetical protein
MALTMLFPLILFWQHTLQVCLFFTLMHVQFYELYEVVKLY